MDYLRLSKLDDELHISSIKEEEESDMDSRRELSVPPTKTEGSKS